jgi:hypothetical protein
MSFAAEISAREQRLPEKRTPRGGRGAGERCGAANHDHRAARARLRNATPALLHEKADSAVRVAAHQRQDDDVILVALEPVDGAHL